MPILFVLTCHTQGIVIRVRKNNDFVDQKLNLVILSNNFNLIFFLISVYHRNLINMH